MKEIIMLLISQVTRIAFIAAGLLCIKYDCYGLSATCFICGLFAGYSIHSDDKGN